MLASSQMSQRHIPALTFLPRSTNLEEWTSRSSARTKMNWMRFGISLTSPAVFRQELSSPPTQMVPSRIARRRVSSTSPNQGPPPLPSQPLARAQQQLQVAAPLPLGRLSRPATLSPAVAHSKSAPMVHQTGVSLVAERGIPLAHVLVSPPRPLEIRASL